MRFGQFLSVMPLDKDDVPADLQPYDIGGMRVVKGKFDDVVSSDNSLGQIVETSMKSIDLFWTQLPLMVVSVVALIVVGVVACYKK